jgi:hypothetical protein
MRPVPHTNIHGPHPQHPRERRPRIGPVPNQRLGPARLAGRAICVKEPLNSNYISIWLWGVLRGPMLGGLGRGLRVSVDHTISHTAV